MTSSVSFMYLFLLLGCVNRNANPVSTAIDTVQLQVSTIETNPLLDTPAFDLDYLMGRFEPAEHPDFVPVKAAHASREGLYLHRETYKAFLSMYEAAKADGVNLKILSATRNFNQQKVIWEDKWTGRRLVDNKVNLAQSMADPVERALKILEYSSMPGTSRHHWGTDIDLNNLNNAYFEKGEGAKVYAWLQEHAPEYGFCQPYTAGRTQGYQEEKWHWSYSPLSQSLTNLAAAQLKNTDFKGFMGAETAAKIGVVEKYVLGIAPACR